MDVETGNDDDDGGGGGGGGDRAFCFTGMLPIAQVGIDFLIASVWLETYDLDWE